MAHSLTQTNIVSLDEGMEISSDAEGNRMDDDDIDIDIDIEEYRHDGINDENMTDDTTHDRQQVMPDAPSGDDVMADEEAVLPTTNDGLMEEEFVIEDEELEDAHDNDLDDTIHFQAQNVFQPTPATAFESVHGAQTDIADPIAVVEVENALPLNEIKTTDVEQPVTLENNLLQNSATDRQNINVESADFEGASFVQSTAVDGKEKEAREGKEGREEAEKAEENNGREREDVEGEPFTIWESKANENELDNLKEKIPIVAEIGTDHDAVNETAEGPSAEEDKKALETSLIDREAPSEIVASNADRHPVIVVYEDEEIYLFPPSNGDTEKSFFLSDPSFLETSIQVLLTACRNVLGENVDADIELEIVVPQLSLAITEDSHDANETKFSDILNVYVKLCHNDAIQEPEPLYVTLTSKARFASRLEELNHAAEQGLGLSVMSLGDDSDIVDDAENESRQTDDDRDHAHKLIYEAGQEDDTPFDQGSNNDSDGEQEVFDDQKRQQSQEDIEDPAGHGDAENQDEHEDDENHDGREDLEDQGGHRNLENQRLQRNQEDQADHEDEEVEGNQLANAVLQVDSSTSNSHAVEAPGDGSFGNNKSTNQSSQTIADEIHDDLIDFGDVGDDPDFVEDASTIKVSENVDNVAVSKDEDSERKSTENQQARSSVGSKADASATSQDSHQHVGHDTSLQSMDQANEIGYDLDEVDDNDPSQLQVSHEKAEIESEPHMVSENAEAQREAGEEWYEDEFGEVEEEEEELGNVGSDNAIEATAEDDSAVKRTQTQPAEPKSISRKRSRDEAEFGNDSVDPGSDTKKVRPTSE